MKTTDALYNVLAKHGTSLHTHLIIALARLYEGLSERVNDGACERSIRRMAQRGKIVRVAPGAYMIVGGRR